MNGDRLECGRCGSRTEVRYRFLDLAQEARGNGERHEGARYASEARCESCWASYRATRDGTKAEPAPEEDIKWL